MTRRRYRLGRDLTMVDETPGDVYVEGRVRLRPGQPIEICGAGEDRGALVLTWMVARLGKDGPVYRGVCRWDE